MAKKRLKPTDIKTKKSSNTGAPETAKRSKYSFLNKEKLDDMYLSKFLKEIWTLVGVPDYEQYVASFYKNPTPMEYVEIQELSTIIKKLRQDPIYERDMKTGKFKLVKNEKTGEMERVITGFHEMSEHDWKRYYNKQDRIYGKVRDIVELSGKDGGPISLSDMSKEDFDKHKAEALEKIRKALQKTKQEFGEE